jgi:hypothetical protein
MIEDQGETQHVLPQAETDLARVAQQRQGARTCTTNTTGNLNRVMALDTLIPTQQGFKFVLIKQIVFS